MTICASVKVRDGLVLATDSMTQIQMLLANGQMGVVKTYSNATKLFQVASLPIGVMSWGIGNIGDRSIQGLMGDFKPAPRTKSIRTVVRAIYSYFKSAYDSQFSDVGAGQAPELGIFVAGYTPGRPFVEARLLR